MNIITLMGRLVADPETRFTNSGSSVATLKIAVKRQGKDGESDFITCRAWNKIGETIQNHFTKGQQILISGRLNIENWEAPDGTKKEKTIVMVSDFDFLGKKENNNTYQPKQQTQAQPQQQKATSKPSYQPKPAQSPPAKKAEPEDDMAWLKDDDSEEMPE